MKIKRLTGLNSRGVTLIEMLVTMGLMAIMLVVLATIFTSSADVQQQSKSYSSVLSSGRYLIARLNYDIANATSVITPATLGSSSSTLELNENGTNYTYSLGSNELQLTDGTGTDSLNGNDVDVSNASFTEIGNPGGKPTIVYSLTINSANPTHGAYETQTFQSAAGLH